jgi:hypothetical protein
MEYLNREFLVIMDLPGAEKGKMPRQFYRSLRKLSDVERLQKSVYLVTSVTVMKELVNLGRDYGFDVQTFQVVKNGHRCDVPPMEGEG